MSIYIKYVEMKSYSTVCIVYFEYVVLLRVNPGLLYDIFLFLQIILGFISALMETRRIPLRQRRVLLLVEDAGKVLN